MIEIKVLFNGVHHHYWENGIKYIDDITSSVILLKVEKQFILIDSGCPIYEEKLISALKKESIKSEQISLIIVTHLHDDHVGNNHLFKNAKIVEGNLVIDFKNKLYTYKTDIFLPEGIEIINTPGHTLPHWSIVAKEDGKNIVFSGDAIRPEMLNEDYSPEGQDIPKLIDSALKICEIADEIVPGHGPNLGREEIEKIKNNLLKFKNK